MAYYVAQMRKNVSDNYMTDVSVSPTTIDSPSPFGRNDITYKDFALSGTFSPDNVYYLRFRVHRIPKYFYSGSQNPSLVNNYINDADSLNLQIILKNSQDPDETKTPPEVIGTCTVNVVEQTQSEAYSSYSFVFSPTRVFDLLAFRINRVAYDAIHIDNNSRRNWLIDSTTDVVNVQRYTGSYDGSTPHTVTISTIGERIQYGGEYGDVCLLNNLIDFNSSANKTGWLKFGYQSRPGGLIVVNGEPIRLGRSGIYQINNGTLIESFMVAAPGGSNSNKIDAFLLDYAYKK